jgi:hypothetical protein
MVSVFSSGDTYSTDNGVNLRSSQQKEEKMSRDHSKFQKGVSGQATDTEDQSCLEHGGIAFAGKGNSKTYGSFDQIM